jgi:hypothetical protein
MQLYVFYVSSLNPILIFRGLGGENASLHIPSAITPNFRKTGYASLEVNKTYTGGFVRQYGNISFTRVFNAGHEVTFYQPETAYHIFTRAMFNTDIATGKTHLGQGKTYQTEGPKSVFSIQKQIPEVRERVCYLWDVLETCTPDEVELLVNRSALVKDFILVGKIGQSKAGPLVGSK